MICTKADRDPFTKPKNESEKIGLRLSLTPKVATWIIRVGIASEGHDLGRLLPVKEVTLKWLS